LSPGLGSSVLVGLVFHVSITADSEAEISSGVPGSDGCIDQVDACPLVLPETVWIQFGDGWGLTPAAPNRSS
jgi:hypothetical protein